MMSMLEAARAAWNVWHTGHDDIPEMNPSFWRGFRDGAEWVEKKYTMKQRGMGKNEPAKR